MRQVSTSSWTFLALWSVVTLMELGAAYIAYDTSSEIHSGFLFLIVIVLNSLALLLFFAQQRIFAIGLTILLFLAIVPRQMYLGYKMIRLQEECANITNYVYQTKLTTGEFPNSLAGYNYKFPQFQKDIGYSLNEDYGFAVSYSLIRTTSHNYDHGNGPYWYYYPD